VEIRRPKPCDWPQIVVLLLDAFGSEYQRSFRLQAQRLRKFIHDWNVDEDVWIAFDGEVIGVLNLGSKFSKKKPFLGKLRIIFRSLPLQNLIFAFRGVLKLRLYFKNSLNIEQVAVSSSCRGKGVGLRLLEFAQERAKELGLERIALMVYGKNPAVGLYQRFGFKTVKTLNKWIYKSMLGYDEVFFMVKEF